MMPSVDPDRGEASRDHPAAEGRDGVAEETDGQKLSADARLPVGDERDPEELANGLRREEAGGGRQQQPGVDSVEARSAGVGLQRHPGSVVRNRQELEEQLDDIRRPVCGEHRGGHGHHGGEGDGISRDM